jgi:hypothetical protein
MPRYCHNQDCSDYGKAQPDKGMNWVCRTCQEDVHSRPPTKKSRLKKKDELPKRQKRDSREIKESKSEKSPNRNLKRQFSDSESSDNEETGGSNDQGKKEQEQPRRKKLRVSLARHVTNTQKQGYRMGVVTWNTHGLQKPQNVSEQDALAFEEHLRFVYQWVEKGTELKEAADLLWNRKDCLKTIKKRLKDYYAVCEDIERELNDQRHWPYLHELRARYEQLVGYRLQISDETRPKELSELKTGALSARAESLDGELREEYASFDDKLHEAIRTLLRKITCLAIVKMFELHKWLDVLVLQEVKYTGITMLIEAIGNDLFVHPGPMMSSGRGKKREIEYFPIIMRKNGKSFHHLHKLSLEKVWWVNTDGTTGKMGLNDKRYLPDGTAHMI